MTAAIHEFSQYSQLRLGAEKNDPETLRAVAGQFESLFLETMLKSMRDASIGDPMLGNSDQFEMYQGMLDKQLSVEMASGKGMGFADLLIRQLGGEQHGGVPTSIGPLSSPPREFQLAPEESGYSLPSSHAEFPLAAKKQDYPLWSKPEEFARDIWPHARRAGKALGVKPEAIVAQAALETGWGKHVMPAGDGNSSYNLFGIKSSGGWQGADVEKNTLEFEDGVARQERARFRAYQGVADAVDDYARFLGENPRYDSVRGTGDDTEGFARALQDSGYATDPRYAEKINAILDSPTMRQALSGLMTSSDDD